MSAKVETVRLCENCKKGYDSYLLNGKNPFCKYRHLHNGQSCTKFEKYGTEVKHNE